MLLEMTIIMTESLLLALREDNAKITIKKGILYMCRRSNFHNHACLNNMLSCTGSKKKKKKKEG